MEYLLDTHSFLWFINGDDQLSEHAKKVISNPDTVKYVSIVSFWEISIKLSLGKLKLIFPFEELRQQVLNNGFDILPVTFEHTAELATLELHHRDPFDRMLIAQAKTEKLTAISKDNNFIKYPGLSLLW